MKRVALLAVIFLASAGCNLLASTPQGVYKSVDSGGTWQASDQIDGAQGNISGLAVAEMSFDPNDHQKLFLGAVNQGLWQSTNSAQNWKQILSKIGVYDYFVDPGNTNSIYAVGTYASHGKIVRSKDGGVTWEEIYNEATANNSVNTITVDPNNSAHLFAALDSGVVIASTDSGVNWFVVNSFNDEALKLRFNKLNNSLYLLLKTKGLAESHDSGKNWNFLTSSLTGNSFFASGAPSFSQKNVDSFTKLALDENSAGIIYMTTSAGLYKTTDDGKTWNFLNIPTKTSGQLPRAVVSAKGGAIVYTSVGNTIFKSLDGGQSWQTEELPTTANINKIIIDPVLNQINYAGAIK